MNRELIKNFIKDHLADSAAFFGACFLIGLFYYIATAKKVEVLYPLALVLFVYLIWMTVRFIEYYRIYKDLENMVQNHDFHGNYHSELYKKVNKAVNRLHADYQNKLSASENIRKKDRRFLSLWIHNMKTPVTVTDLLLQRMEQGEIDPAAGLQELKEENQKLLTNLNHILTIIRLEDFARDYCPEPIDLLEELKSVINKNKSLFIYSRVFPKIKTDLQKAVILSDRKWNELMINQLISNGVKYSKDEQGESKNIYFIVTREDNQICLTIKDEGIGIPEHDLGKVFEPFFTGENGRKGYQSSGIGLYFCREVCKLLGHTLKISSEEGKGTSVTITYLAKL